MHGMKNILQNCSYLVRNVLHIVHIYHDAVNSRISVEFRMNRLNDELRLDAFYDSASRLTISSKFQSSASRSEYGPG